MIEWTFHTVPSSPKLITATSCKPDTDRIINVLFCRYIPTAFITTHVPNSL